MASRSHEIQRARGIRLLQAGVRQAEVARRLNVSRSTVHVWSKLLQADRYSPLTFRKRGRPCALSADELVRLRHILEQPPPASAHGGASRWTLARVAERIRSEFDVSYSVSQVSRILHAIGWDIRSGRPRPAGTGTFGAWWAAPARAHLAHLAQFFAAFLPSAD